MEWCLATKQRHSVVSGAGEQKHGFGTCTKECRVLWHDLKCERFVHLWATKRKETQRNTTVCKGDAATQDMIAVCFGSTTRGVETPGRDTLALFRYLLPSIQETAECGFRYGIFIGYDYGDPYWDLAATRAQFHEWFAIEIAAPLRMVNILAAAHLLPVRGLGYHTPWLSRTSYRTVKHTP